MRAWLLAAASAVAGITGAAAQDTSLDAAYGSVSLDAGFADDPHEVSLNAGGSIDATVLGDGCAGQIADAPDFELTYEAGDYPLYISATSDADTTLVVNTPNGEWVCNDDLDGSLNPGLEFESPLSGVYDVWVGTFSGSDIPAATLRISELGFGDSTSGGASSGDEIDWRASPTYGDADLTAGFAPDPYSVDLTPGGSIDASTVDGGCAGQVASAPDFDLRYTPGDYPLYIYVESDEDTTLVINTPSGEWICDDDSSAGVNPGVGFKAPEEGLYDIWVGRYEGGASGTATLSISETTFPQD